MTKIKNKRSFTEIEINNQPNLWEDVYKLILEKSESLKKFIGPLMEKKGLEIILTGAGSSAFLGEAAQAYTQINTGCQTRAVSTTDIVTHPHFFFQKNHPILLVSFARSGNSPESIETVNLADQYCDEVYHLIITCNHAGELMKYTSKKSNKSYGLLLPEDAHDKSLAMTGSFTSMLLSILLISDLDNIQEKESSIKSITSSARNILEKSASFEEIANTDFERVVFLGSGPLVGIARESHLKLQELTDGKVICKHDSFLGFRHGPRAVINDKTLLVYLFSTDDHVFQYEFDLADSNTKQLNHIPCVAVGRKQDPRLNACFNIDLHLNSEEQLAVVPATLIGQLLGLYKSLNLGLDPDNPSVSGTISRVVQGVKIYPQKL
ncbi:SIS domain-containing protein [Gramella jeungdoensis]|uniref:SIS domain-containing protein n=1 Tax=Gramella jeungdoensis TaxID=708091 RepID=A0ABT0Z3N7_9FLAO|nr:SIS domain-containing protein [Gramella jeungdoensis]MCM8570353.1 SIS domain-containing protein [Gramella jeungdoensis]